MNAFLYLVWTSWSNRIRSSVRRARSPRYGAALLVGVLYIWAFLVRPVNQPGAASFLLGKPTEMIVTLLTVITLMGSWVFGADATALAFSEPEVSFLFSAPLSRRSLIVYKLVRAQIAVMINAMIWVFVLRRGGTALPSPLRAVSLWVLFSTLNLHRLGAALVRASFYDHGRAGLRRTKTSIAAFVLIGVAIIGGVIVGRARLDTSGDTGAFLMSLGNVLSLPPAWWGLFPFHLVVAPTFARSPAEWLKLIGPALVVMVLHAWWVLSSDTAFEDAALEASAERARRAGAMRSRRTVLTAGAPRNTGTLPLATRGHPALAIIWKNLLCLRRTSQFRVFVGPIVMAAILGPAMAGTGPLPTKIGMSALVLTGMLVIFGGRLIRNDLRQDMQHLPLLKTLPLPASQIIVAEVASSALPMTAVQLVLLVIALFGFVMSPDTPIERPAHVAVILATPLAVFTVNAALVTGQNAMAVLFPAWVRLGPAVTTGVETLGQNVLGTIANLLSLALALVVPALVGWAIIGPPRLASAPAIAIALVVGSVILAAETYGGMRYLGSALARAEPLNA